MSTRGPVVRLRDVAAAAGVDVSLVSRVLNDDPRASCRPETRQRILDAAERLHYRPHTAARSLKTARTMAIGMVVPDLANAVYATIARGAEDAVRAAGYILLLATGSARDRLRVLEGRIDGLLIAIATSETLRPGELGGDLPMVLVNRREDIGVPSVTVDDEAGAALAVRHLVELGHRRIAHIAGPGAADTSRRRRRGFVAGMRAAGLEADQGLVRAGAFDEASGFVAATRLLTSGSPPTAIFANLRSAIGALSAAYRAGYRVPEDVSVIALHDAPVAAYLNPPLTTVRMPDAQMGAQAVEALFSVLSGRPAEHVVVATPPELVVRGSTAPPR